MDEATTVDRAEEAAEVGRVLRLELARKVKPGLSRDRRIIPVLDQLDDAAKPLRSLIGRFIFEKFPQHLEQRARRSSFAIQSERRQLKKMLRGPRL